MDKCNQKLKKVEVIELCNSIIEYLANNPTALAWKTEFLSKKLLSANYISEWAKRDPDIKELNNIIKDLHAYNYENAIATGLVNPGFGTWRLKCLKHPDFSSINENLQNEKLKTEIKNISKSNELIDSQIIINLTEASHRSDEDIERLLNE